MKTEELIVRYGIQEEVDAFVVKRCAELSTGYEVRFSGHCRQCCNKSPHVPHATGEYSTVRYGMLDYFCCGVEGDGIEIIDLKYSDGDAATPSFFKAKVKDAPQEIKEAVENFTQQRLYDANAQSAEADCV